MSVKRRPFLFVFGFETPGQFRRNRLTGDDENSWAVFITATDSEFARGWGQQIAEELVRRLWIQAGENPRSWIEDGFSHWIELDESEIAAARGSPLVPSVDDGEMPDFDRVLEFWKDG